MTRHSHPTDDVRRLPLVTDEQVHHLADPQAKQALFEEITAQPADSGAEAPSSHRGGVPRRSMVLAAALACLSLAAVGWAVYHSVAETTEVACHLGENDVAHVDAVTGNPVADCAAVWRRQTGSEPPPLAAYANGRGGVAVIPEDASVPGGWRELEAGVAQDPRVAELRAALGDYIDGLKADCHPLDSARTVATRELDRLGLNQWQVVAERGAADGENTCTFFVLNSPEQQVVLLPLDRTPNTGDAAYKALATKLGQALNQECLSLEDAAARTRKLAADVGIDPDKGLVVDQASDETTRCARADVNPGGRATVTIRGPQTP